MSTRRGQWCHFICWRTLTQIRISPRILTHPLLVFLSVTELKSLNLELTSLSMLASSMRDELDELKARRRMAEWNFTLSGKVWLAIGHVFAAYCVMRMVVVGT